MKWSEVLSQWESGNYPKVPKTIKSPYFWRTSVQSNKNDLIYKEEFKSKNRLFSVLYIKVFIKFGKFNPIK